MSRSPWNQFLFVRPRADRQRSLIPGLFVRMFTGKNGLATEASSTVLAT